MTLYPGIKAMQEQGQLKEHFHGLQWFVVFQGLKKAILHARLLRDDSSREYRQNVLFANDIQEPHLIVIVNINE